MSEFRMIKIASGTPRQRGEDYGTQAREEIHVAVEAYKAHFDKNRGMGWEAVRQAAAAHIAPVEAALPHLMEEIRGIADGSGTDVHDIMAINCRYEILHFPRQPECTSFAILGDATADNHVYVGQNWDNRPFAMKHSVLLHTTLEDGRRVMGLTEGGQLLRNGISTAGVGLAANSLHSTHDFAGTGIPVSILRRHLLAMDSADDMRQYVLGAARSVSVNYMLADSAGRAFDVEAIPGEPYVYEPVNGILTHANHILGNIQIDAQKRGRFRGERLHELLSQQQGSITLPFIMECLKDHHGYPESICSHISESDDGPHKLWHTNASLIFDLTALKLWLCWGPPCSGTYKEYAL